MARKKRTVRKKTAPSGARISKLIQPVRDTTDNLVMLVYGRSGTGKTQFGSTFPRPILFLDINEKGLDTIRHEKRIDVLRCKTWDDFEEAYWYLEAGTKYKSIIVDQISNLQDLGMAEVRAKAKKSSRELFTRKNWGELSGMLKTEIDNYRHLDDRYNLCFLAHERTDDGGDADDEALEPNVGARVMPSVASFLDGAVDAIGSTYIRESFVKAARKKRERRVEYCMRIGPHAFYSTKIRRPVEAGPLPEFIINPAYTKINNLISGKIIPVKKKATKKRRRK